MTIRPLGRYVVIEREEVRAVRRVENPPAPPALSSAEILLPPVPSETSQWGTVLAAGPAALRMGVEVGERVACGRYAGARLRVAGRERLIVDAAEVLLAAD